MNPRTCARCKSAQPAAARYCHRCGHDHLDAHPIEDRRRRLRDERAGAYVVRPKDRVRSINPVTALLPLSNAAGVRAYEWAFGAGLVVPLIAVLAGWVPFALVAAALAVPAVFTLYLYDVNEWDDQPVPVVLGCIAVAGALGAVAIRLIDATLLDAADKVGLERLSSDSFDTRTVAALGVVAPLVAVVLALAVPLSLASRPRFDDMIDGLTFGAVAGAAYAAGETLMMHRGVLDGLVDDGGPGRGDAALWLSIVANAAIVKPLVYSTALAIAAAGFSGIGAGYEGFGRRFATSLGVAASAMVAYGLGVAVTGEIGGATGAALGLAWGVVVAGGLIVALRTKLHLGVLEAALEAARGRPNRHEVRGEAHCGECDMFLAPLALFCSACGTSVRATSKRRQHDNVRANVGAPS